MSWLRDESGDLVNLDHVAALDISQLEESDESCIVARLIDGSSRIIDTGTEAQMKNKSALISGKLPLVKLT